MENQDIRWKQRFSNFEKALLKLSEVIEKKEILSDLEKEGLIQRFEFTHELSWQVMKDFLIYDGIQNIIGSRSAVREAFNKGIISNGEIWMEMIESRNRTSHTYLESILESEYNKITKNYYPLFIEFQTKMKSLL
ncbi:nucleotidyltransferase substrate binding protein [Flavobacterium sp.]|jgi:nucleotidyltransferase substrate binding protein (TIGR01987 family)|uniref:nucleotidyltransferase substrate binding protein n=1 Tax=Flavobacterium sp. TaxID=239 RepID=UPI0037C03BAC